jgi:hypothetical protein
MKTTSIRRAALRALLFCAISTVTPLGASAAPITVPSDLNVGDKYRLVFVTSPVTAAVSSNINDYNAFVTATANSVPALAALGTTWTAIASTISTNAHDNTGTNPAVSTGTPIYRLDDTRVADDNSDLWDGDIQVPIEVLEDGTTVPVASFDRAWTGTDPYGFAASGGLGDVSNSLWVGSVFSDTMEWVYLYQEHDISMRRLYGISGELTVVPEPGAMILMGIGAVAVLGRDTRRRRQDKPQ